MEIVERREHGGTWWGRDPAGAWHRWNAASNGWDGPLAPPWPPSEQPHPEEASIVARAPPTGGAPPPPPMNRVDAWWNRHFPPFSIRRLVFGLVALPVIAALTELLWVAAGRGFSLPRYLFVCIAGGVLLGLMTWSDPGLGAFSIGWGLGSVMLFLFAYPMWRRARDLEARGLRLPMWLVMGGSVLLVAGAALVFVAER